MSYPLQQSNQNALIARLPVQDAAYLNEISRIAHPPPGQILASRSEPATDLWFPHSGIVALIHTDRDGRSVQTGVVGSDGCLGLEGLFEQVAPAHPVPGSPALPDAIVQVEGPMSVISAVRLRAAIVSRPAILSPLTEFLMSLANQSRQTIACNRLHGLLPRCCRWLLTIQDYLSSDDLPVTQETLATLLGGGRPRINGALATLEKLGILHRHRGRIRVLRRAGLEALRCGCGRAIHREFEPNILTEL